LGGEIFSNVTGGPKVVTITVPDNAAWTGKTATYTGSENTTGGPHWGEGFRGKGWTSGGAYVDSSSSIVNENINLTITAE
jgi:hypothetical protein